MGEGESIFNEEEVLIDNKDHELIEDNEKETNSEDEEYDMDDDWLVAEDEEEIVDEVHENDIEDDLIRQDLKSLLLTLQMTTFESLVTRIQNEAFKNEDVVHPNKHKRNLKFCFWNKQGFEVD